jgi:mRNA interferase RelE/StbE
MLTFDMYSIEYSKAARKALKRMPRTTAERILEKVEALAVDPWAPNNNIKKLTNHPGYRLRVGDWRVIYLVREKVLLLVVVRIAPKGEVYQ